MKQLQKSFTVELTADEIEIITTALHGEYKFIKELRQKPDQSSPERLHQKQQNTQKLRNDFAELINRHYMGEDA